MQLAIVNMADQYTRISCGGSPLPKNAPVVGLLFGECTDDGHWQIVDSDDIPVTLEHQSAAERQVSLHHAVFPQHSVVGWYRVSAVDDEPTANDWRLMVELELRYGGSSGPFIFSLLQADTSRKDNNEEADLPFTLYKLSENKKSLVAVEDWTLETSDSERIGLEHVVRYQPSRRSTVGEDSAFCDSAKDIQHSLQMIQSRLAVVETFLVDTQAQTIPLNPPLLRQVQSLLWQLGPLRTSWPEKKVSPDVIAQLAVLTRTVDAVESYTDKFAKIHERRATREGMRRGFNPFEKSM